MQRGRGQFEVVQKTDLGSTMNQTLSTNIYKHYRDDFHTFIPEGEPSHLRKVLEGLQADDTRRPESGDAHLVLLDESGSSFALFPRLLVHQTD